MSRFLLLNLLFYLFSSLSSGQESSDSIKNKYPFWGEYNKTPVSEIQPAAWIKTDTTFAGWDWSLPNYVEPSSISKLCIARNFNLGTRKIDQLPEVYFPCNPVISHWVRWRELEPVEGNINFQPLMDNINLASQKGYSSIVRIHFSAIDFAPDWIKNYNIPIREEEKEDPIKTNYEVSHPEFHSRYLKFIKALGESGIPQMEEVKGLYLGYASPSNGDEGIGPYSEGNAVANDTVQHVIERIDAWAEACKGVEYKVFMGGLSNYGFSKGFGIRRGFVEMYLYHIPDENIGQELDSKNYLYVDESCPVIAKNLFQGEENEEYEESWATGGSRSRFGDLESFPYRYFTANLRLLQMRCNYLLNNEFALLPEMLSWVSLEMGRTIEDTPDAWCTLRESYLKLNGGTPVKNFERWIYQRDAPGYETTPALKIEQAIQMWMVQEGKYYDYVARKGKKIGFDVDDRMFPGGEQRMAVKVTFYDGVPGALNLVYKNNTGLKSDSVITHGTDSIRTATFFINARLDDTGFDNEYDFILESEEEVPVLFVRVIKTEEIYENTDQLPYGGIKRSIPGIVEAEHYDVGDPGFAWQDDDLKEGDINFRPTDSVDVIMKAGASNDYTVSFTNEGEWLEYTVEATTGKYSVTLYYYCGETPGDLLVSLGHEILDTITGIKNQGWEVRDSITVENIRLTGGASKILRLEFINGAGFDIDAIKFVKVRIPVSGVTLSGCPTEDVSAGDKFSLYAEVTPFDADEKELRWSSSDVSIASVDEYGLVTSNSEGTATISVTTAEGGYSAECQLNVVAEVISVYGVTIGDCPGYILETGNTHQLTANVAPVDATDPSVNWNSSNLSVATVDENGLVKAVSQGTATIMVTTNDGGYAKTCNLGVMSTAIPVSGIVLNDCPTVAIAVDSTIQLTASISPADAGDQSLSWSSSNPEIGTVDENGLVRALSVGETTISVTANDGGFTDECTLTVDFKNSVIQFGSVAGIVKVFPNPAATQLFCDFPNSGFGKKIELYNAWGQLLMTKTTHQKRLTLDIRELNSEGLLMVKISSGQYTGSFKVILSKLK